MIVPDTKEKDGKGSAWIWMGCILLGIVIGFLYLMFIALKVKTVE